jgi:O-antigen ligase
LLAAGALFGVILTGSRGALLSWVLFILLMCSFSNVRMRAAIHGFLALIASAGLVWYLHESGLLPSPNIFGRAGSMLRGEEAFDSSRLVVWAESVRQIMARPVFGSGPEGYWLSGCCSPHILQAHNFVLQFLMEFGFVGCGIAVLLLARTVRALGGAFGVARRVMATPANRLLACMLGAFLAYGLIDQVMYHLLPLLHLALLVGLLAAGLARSDRA